MSLVFSKAGLLYTFSFDNKAVFYIIILAVCINVFHRRLYFVDLALLVIH